MTKYIAWGLAIAAIIVNYLGYELDLYQAFWWFDRVLHGATLFAITFWFSVVVFTEVFSTDHARGIRAFLLLGAFGVAIGALWEVAEWGVENFTPSDVIKGKYDTILDIIMDTFGAFAAAGLAQLRHRGPHSS